MRINASLDGVHFEKLEYLKQATQSGTSEVLKRAIDAYYREIQGSTPASALDILTASGFIASGRRDEALSEGYKEHLSAGLAEKFLETESPGSTSLASIQGIFEDIEVSGLDRDRVLYGGPVRA
jgi:hypothetical protein